MNFKKPETLLSVGIIVLLLLAAGIIGYSERISLLALTPYLPIQEWSDVAITWLNTNLEVVFDTINFIITAILMPINFFFTELPPVFIVVFLTAVSYLIGGWRVSGFVLGSLLIVTAMGFFEPTMITLALVITATLLALIIGIPVGIAKAHSRTLTVIVDPILDFMQTMPLFVYLIPAVLFFSIGNIPGIVATFIFATPPAVRLTALGIEQISKELIEAGHAFGATPRQFLFKIEIPLALPSIMAGVNQTIMLALSMVVIASMVGAEGLGLEVYNAITRLRVGQGIASGIGIVLLAMILDRMTKAVGTRK